MEQTSPLKQVKALESQVQSILSFVDAGSLSLDQRDVLAILKHQLIDARLEVRDYAYAQTRAEQEQAIRQAKRHLKALQKSVLQASQFGVFGAVDVAQLSARIEQIAAQL